MRFLKLTSAVMAVGLGFIFQLSAAEGDGGKAEVAKAAELTAQQRRAEPCKKKCTETREKVVQTGAMTQAASAQEVFKESMSKIENECKKGCETPPHTCKWGRLSKKIACGEEAVRNPYGN